MKCKVIGITGGIATGKSTAARIFKKYIPVYFISADEIAHNVILPGRISYKKIVKYFGKEILKKDNVINRKKLSRIIFNNRTSRKKLEAITHPQIIAEIKKRIREDRREGNCKFIILEAPLLFEAKIPHLADIIIVVASSKKIQIRRLLKKGLRKIDAEKRIFSQMPLKEKIKKADFVIYNNGSIKNLQKKVMEIVNQVSNKEEK